VPTWSPESLDASILNQARQTDAQTDGANAKARVDVKIQFTAMARDVRIERICRTGGAVNT
jgi:hypothetical protein